LENVHKQQKSRHFCQFWVKSQKKSINCISGIFQKYFSTKLVRDVMSLANIRLLNIALCITSVRADLSANLLKIQVGNYDN
jgi:hypothetical protein